MLRLQRLLVGAAVLALLLAAGAASARTIHDRKGDSKPGQADIASVTASSTETIVIFRIVSYIPFPTKRAPCIGISLSAQVTPPGDNIEICGNGVLQDFAHGGGSVGHAKVLRPNSKTIVYRVPRSHLAKAKTIGWEAQVRNPPACFPNICDQAPEGPAKHIVQRL
jgi:hypothetical protein